MVLALTWWGWSGLVVAVVAIWFAWARHAWRTTVREQLVDYLERTAPDVTIVHVRTKGIVFKGPRPDAPHLPLPLAQLYRDVAVHGGISAEAEAARLALFAAVAEAMRAHAHGRALASPPAGAERDPFRRAS